MLDNLERKPDLVVLGLGGNDMLRGIKPAETRANMAAMIDELKKREIPVDPDGNAWHRPIWGRIMPMLSTRYFRHLPKQYNAPLYPFFLDGVVTDKALMLDDNIHPNAKGVAQVVEGLSPLVEGALKAQGDTVLEK